MGGRSKRHAGPWLVLSCLTLAGCLPEDYLATPISTEICPSGLMWAHGDEPSSRMYPGSDCITCHRNEADEDEIPSYSGAGTVFVQENEKTNCFGVEDAEVILTFADGRNVTAHTNQAGNFWFMPQDGPFQMPFKVTVGYGGRYETADEIHDDMNCGACHDARGEPARITIP